jgi:hypothetical protein
MVGQKVYTQNVSFSDGELQEQIERTKCFTERYLYYSRSMWFNCSFKENNYPKNKQMWLLCLSDVSYDKFKREVECKRKCFDCLVQSGVPQTKSIYITQSNLFNQTDKTETKLKSINQNNIYHSLLIVHPQLRNIFFLLNRFALLTKQREYAHLKSEETSIKCELHHECATEKNISLSSPLLFIAHRSVAFYYLSSF